MYDGPVTLQESEVESGEWLALDEVRRLTQAEPCCPDSLLAFDRLWRGLQDGSVPPLPPPR